MIARLTASVPCSETGKLKIGTRQIAKRIARNKARQFGVKFKVYRCQHCEAFHLATRR